MTVLYEVVREQRREQHFMKEKDGGLKSLSEYLQIVFLSICAFFALNFDLTETEWWEWVLSVP